MVALFEELKRNLRSNPRSYLCNLSKELKIDRHTIGEAVRLGGLKSFREFQKGVTLQRAISLLCDEPSLSVKEASFLVGYASPQAFSRFTKKVCGLSPTQLRTKPLPIHASRHDKR